MVIGFSWKNAGICLLIVVQVFYDILRSILGPTGMLLPYSMCLFLVFLGIVRNGEYRRIMKEPVDIAWLFLFALFLWRNGDFEAGNNLTFVITLVSFFLFPMLSVSKHTSSSLCRILAWTTGIHVVATLLMFAFPGLYGLFSSSFGNLAHWYEDDISKGYVAGITGHYSTNAVMLALFILVAVSAMLCGYKTKSNIASVVLAGIALVLTTKRAQSVFAAVTLIVLYYLLTWKEGALKSLLKLVGVVIASCVFLEIARTQIPALNNLFRRFEDISSNIRFVMWEEAINIFKENPMLGIGWDQYRLQSSNVKVLQQNLQIHNVYIQLLCETGIVGFTLFVGVQITMLSRTIKAIYNHKYLGIMGDKLWMLLVSGAIQLFFTMYGMTGNFVFDVFFPYYVIAISLGRVLLREIKTQKGQESL